MLSFVSCEQRIRIVQAFGLGRSCQHSHALAEHSRVAPEPAHCSQRPPNRRASSDSVDAAEDNVTDLVGWSIPVLNRNDFDVGIDAVHCLLGGQHLRHSEIGMAVALRSDVCRFDRVEIEHHELPHTDSGQLQRDLATDRTDADHGDLEFLQFLLRHEVRLESEVVSKGPSGHLGSFRDRSHQRSVGTVPAPRPQSP